MSPGSPMLLTGHEGDDPRRIKLSGHLIPDEDAGPATSGVWMRKEH